MADGCESPPKKKLDNRAHGSPIPVTQECKPMASSSVALQDASTTNALLSDESSNRTRPKMFCCGKHHTKLSASKREDTLFHKASGALIELLLKIRNVGSSTSGIPDFTVLDREEFKDSPLKAFFEANFSLVDKELVDNLSFLAIQKTIDADTSETTKQKLEGVLRNPDISTSSSIIEKLQSLLDTEVTKAKEREDATKFAMETCRRKLELLINDSNDQEWVTTLHATLDNEDNNATCRVPCDVCAFINSAGARKSGRKSSHASSDVAGNEGSNMYVPTPRTISKWNQLNSEKIGDEEYEKLRTVYETITEAKLSKPDKIIECISLNRHYRASATKDNTSEKVCGVCKSAQFDMVLYPVQELPVLAIAFSCHQEVSVHCEEDVCKDCVVTAMSWLEQQINQNKDCLLYQYVDAQKSPFFELVNQIKGTVRVIPRKLGEGEKEHKIFPQFRALVRDFISHTLVTYGSCKVSSIFDTCQNYIPSSYLGRDRHRLNELFAHFAEEFIDVSLVFPSSGPKKGRRGGGGKSKPTKDFRNATFFYYGPTSGGSSSKLLTFIYMGCTIKVLLFRYMFSFSFICIHSETII